MINEDDAAFLLFRDRLGRESVEYISKLFDLKDGNPKFWEYWENSVSENTKQYYKKCIRQYIAEKETAEFKNIPIAI